MSKEHLYGDWANRVVADDPINYSVLDLTPVGPMTHNYECHRRRQGHVGQTTIRKVCKNCNNVWMKALEDRVKPIVSPLMLGNCITLDSDAQSVVSQWAMKIFLLQEFNKGVTAQAVSDRERLDFMKGQMPAGCIVWIGKSEIPARNKVWVAFESAFMAGSQELHTLKKFGFYNPAQYYRNTFYGTHVRGGMVLHVFYSAKPSLTRLHHSGWQFSGERNLKRIYPDAHRDISLSDIPMMSQTEIYKLHFDHFSETSQALARYEIGGAATWL